MRGAAVAASLLAALAGCAHNLAPVQHPPGSVALVTPGLNVSMIYLARVEGGVVAVDLGWVDAARHLERGLARLDASPEQVTDVFLTHSHRDHVGGWRRVAGATFHLFAPEVERFLGRAPHRGFFPGLAEWLRGSDLPAEGEVRVRGFASDTAFAFGADTLRAFPLPGHTAGSAAYLFRGILFVGDAVARPPLLGFRRTPPGFADAEGEASASLEGLWERVAPYRVEWVCTAHAKCAPYTETLRRKLGGGER